jgi:hypothetical protein
MARNASNRAKKQKKSRKGSGNPGDHAAAAASATPDTAQAFETWLDDAGLVWRKFCRLGEAVGRGQGVFAARDIAAGEVVLAVPDDAVLMPDDSCIAKVCVAAQHTSLCKCAWRLIEPVACGLQLA